MNKQELLNLKEQIEQAKTKIATLQGEENSLMKQLKELGCKTVEEAEKKVKELSTEIEKLEDEIDEKTEILTKKWWL